MSDSRGEMKQSDPIVARKPSSPRKLTIVIPPRLVGHHGTPVNTLPLTPKNAQSAKTIPLATASPAPTASHTFFETKPVALNNLAMSSVTRQQFS